MNHLLRSHAPISDSAWKLLDDEARERLTVALGARKLVDFLGPRGWEYSASDLGRVGPAVDAAVGGVVGRARRVLPLAEIRAPFALSREELWNHDRGAVDPDLEALDDAAVRIASVENAAIFHGWPDLGVKGIIEAAPHPALPRETDAGHYPALIAHAVATLLAAGITGPYGLALSPAEYTEVIESSENGGYPLLRHLNEILGGPIVWVPGLHGGVVLSMRGGDFLFESGEDLAIGYDTHDASTVEFYLEETFSFQVATPEAAIALTAE